MPRINKSPNNVDLVKEYLEKDEINENDFVNDEEEFNENDENKSENSETSKKDENRNFILKQKRFKIRIFWCKSVRSMVRVRGKK